MAKKISLSAIDTQNIVAEASLDSLETPKFAVLPAMPKLSWEQWAYVNIDEFRKLFPEFRQLEQTAIPQILTGFFQNSSPDLSFYNQVKASLEGAGKITVETQAKRQTQLSYLSQVDKVVAVYDILQSNPDLAQRGMEWAQKVKTAFSAKTPIDTPTVLAKKR